MRSLTSQDHGVAKCGAGLVLLHPHSTVGRRNGTLETSSLEPDCSSAETGKGSLRVDTLCTVHIAAWQSAHARLCENVSAMQAYHGQQLHALGQLCELSDHSMCSKQHVQQAPSPAIWRGDANSCGSLSLEQRKVSTLNASLWPRSLLLRQTASGLEYPKP